MGRVIIPKTYVKDIALPLIFLAGPIRSAPNWQDQAIELLFSRDPDLVIASPRRGARDKIAPYIAEGDESYFPRQRAWEWYYMNKAAENGCILFWLPKEAEHHCDKSYAFMTSNEFGHWTAYRQLGQKVNLAIGTDGKFTEWHTLEYDLKVKCPDLVPKVKNTLEQTCDEAIRLARQ
jgi:hypothetical protein